MCPYLDRLFPAATASRPIEKSTLKKQHPKAYALAKLEAFPLYTFQHTCLPTSPLWNNIKTRMRFDIRDISDAAATARKEYFC